MPTYEYRCEKCEIEFERFLPIAEYDSPQKCEECGTVGKKQISSPGLIFVGDGWASKNNRIAGQMQKKNERVSAKQEERKRDAPGVKLVPNFEGERTSSWSEAAKMAASKGKSAESYASKIRSERTVKTR
jgi:putative FmdB family regulatory protein